MKKRRTHRRYDPVWPDLLKIAAGGLLLYADFLAVLSALAKSAW